MPPRVLLQPDILIDPSSQRHLESHWLLLDGSKIAALGSGAPPQGVETMRLVGKTVMPGLVDSHGHLAFRHANGPLRDQLSADRPAQLRLATANMRARLAQGITLMRDLSELDFLDIEVRQLQEEGAIFGPRLICATRGIRAPQAHGFCGTPFRGEDEIRDAVSANHARGAQLIKLYLTGSLYGSARQIGEASFPLTETRAAVEEAHRLGLPVSAHALAGTGIDRALDAGVDCIEHGLFPDDRHVALMARQGTWLSTTYAYTVGVRAPAAVRDDAANDLSALWLRAKERLARMREAGVAIAAGTDEGSGGIAAEARALADLGMPAWEVLDAVTYAGARLAGLGTRAGALRPGFDADLVVLDGNPRLEIDALARVHAVIQGGRWWDPAELVPV